MVALFFWIYIYYTPRRDVPRRVSQTTNFVYNNNNENTTIFETRRGTSLR